MPLGYLRPQGKAGGGDSNSLENMEWLNSASRANDSGWGDNSPGNNCVAQGMCYMIQKALNGSFTGGLSLDDESSEGKHSEASVLDFLNFQLLNVALGVTEGVENASGVSDFMSRQRVP
mmetsp:Transcript_38775/g.53866  ORF Transcript_38775/g.53866 Transcript_38775/m.53866 type:complete len:119 (+) Transcript_38775:248-604(+)